MNEKCRICSIIEDFRLSLFHWSLFIANSFSLGSTRKTSTYPTHNSEKFWAIHYAVLTLPSSCLQIFIRTFFDLRLRHKLSCSDSITGLNKLVPCLIFEICQLLVMCHKLYSGHWKSWLLKIKIGFLPVLESLVKELLSVVTVLYSRLFR